MPRTIAAFWQEQDWNIDSPIEEWFVRTLEKYVHANVEVRTQERIMARGKPYRADVVIGFESRRFIVECDGKDYHNEESDQQRDFDILADSDVRVIYRIPGRSLFIDADRALYVLSLLEPQIFSGRGLTNLRPQFDKSDLLVEGYKEFMHASFNGVGLGGGGRERDDRVWLKWRGAPSREWAVPEPRLGL